MMMLRFELNPIGGTYISRPAKRRGIVYYEPARDSRTIILASGRLHNIRTPPMVIVDIASPMGHHIHLFRVRADVPVLDVETLKTPIYNVLRSGICVGDEALDMLRRREITAPEAVWMTAWEDNETKWWKQQDAESRYWADPKRIRHTIEEFVCRTYDRFEWK